MPNLFHAGVVWSIAWCKFIVQQQAGKSKLRQLMPHPQAALARLHATPMLTHSDCSDNSCYSSSWLLVDCQSARTRECSQVAATAASLQAANSEGMPPAWVPATRMMKKKATVLK